MLLNKETFEIIRSLFPRMPYEYVCYCGVSIQGWVRFEVGVSDEHSNVIAGVLVSVTQEFKIKSIERLYTTWGKYCKNKPFITEKIPIHPSGQQVSYRNTKLITCMGDMRHYEYNKLPVYDSRN